MATDFGTDIYALQDLPANFNLASGLRNVALALLRRLTTPRGWLFEKFGGDPDYGYNILGKLNTDLTVGEIAAIEGAIEDECEKDERVLGCTASLTYSFSTQTALIDITCETDAGPFDLVMSIDQVTASVLVNGEVLATVPAIAETTTTVVGPVGPTGPPGPAGAPGGGGGAAPTVEIEADGEFADSTGAEVLVADEPRDFSGLGGTLTAQLIADVRSAAGVATFRLWVGGTLGGIDGTVVAAITRNAAAGTAFVAISASGSIANPGSVQRVKITMQSSGAAADAGIKDAEASLRG